MNSICLALNLPELPTGGFNSPDYAQRYIGSGWVRWFYQLAESRGIHVLSGQQALAQGAREGLLVIQEELNIYGRNLIAKGAIPKVVFCAESKLYNPYFYDYLPELKKTFPVQILFDGGTDYLHFPCLEPEDLELAKVKKNDRVCMIAANKQWWNQPQHPHSPSWCEAIQNELHTERLRAIERYGKEGRLDLYGPGWDIPELLPAHWRAYLIPIIEKCYQGICGDKLKTMAQYGSAVCIENTEIYGYHTEKAIQALAVGTHPILHDRVESLSARELLHVGKNRLHFYEDFAKMMLEKCLN